MDEIVKEQIIELINSGKKSDAAKLYKLTLGVDLKIAKNHIDNWLKSGEFTTDSILESNALVIDTVLDSYIEFDMPFEQVSPLDNSNIDDLNLDIKKNKLNKKNKLLTEINSLIKECDSIEKVRLTQEVELKELQIQLNLKNIKLSDLVNSEYSNDNIRKKIKLVIEDLKSLFNDHYYSDIKNEKLHAEIKSKIFTNSLEDIIYKLEFKHNSLKLFFYCILKSLFPLAFAVFFAFLAFVHIGGLDGNLLTKEFAKLMIWFFFFILSASITKVILTPISIYSGKKFIALINNHKSDELAKKLNYLNSIHKLPKEVIHLIKQK